MANDFRHEAHVDQASIDESNAFSVEPIDLDS